MAEHAEQKAEQPLTEQVLALLRCPVTRSPLRLEGGWLVAQKPEGAGLRYPIRDGIPVLLIDQAQLPDGVGSMEAFRAKYGIEKQ